MLDPHLLRATPEAVEHALAARGFALDVAACGEFEAHRKRLQIETQDLQTQRNQRSKEIGAAKARGKISPLLKRKSQCLASASR